MSRTILYYPSIAIRNPRWIRQMILYWDAIGTIVPHELSEAAYASLDLQKLRRANMLHLYHPEEKVKHAEKLTEEFREIHAKVSFPKVDHEKHNLLRGGYSVYSMKIPRTLRDYLIDERIAEYSSSKSKMEMSKESGLLYMSLLAKYLANDESHGDWVTTPGTDYGAYANIILETISDTNALPGLSFTLNNVLPYPSENVDIDVILEFKKTRKDELLQIRKKIYEFQSKIRNEVRDSSDLKEYLEQFSEELTFEISQIEKEAKKAKIPTMLGTVETILAAGDSPLIRTLEKALPAPLPFIAQTVSGLISLKKYKLDVQNQQQDKLMENAFSYIYHAQQEGIVSPQ